MIYKKKKDIKIFVMPMLVLAFAIFFVLAFDLTLKNIEENNTWQNNATFDYVITTEVLKDEDGKEILDENGNIQYQQVYNISSASQLAGAFINSASAESITSGNISKFSGTIYKITNHIDMSKYTWVAVDVSSGQTFDGGGFSLDFNYNINEGFINKNDGAVINVFLFNINSQSSSKNEIGGVVNQNNGTVKNCHVYGDESIVSTSAGITSSNGRLGGIVGNSSSGEIINCTSEATVAAGRQVGGIVGRSYNTKIINCKNYGRIVTRSGIDQTHYAGGITGYLSTGSNSFVDACLNYGEVVADATSGKTSYAGGITGYSSYGEISNSGNTGAVTAGTRVSAASRAGGIAGYSNTEIDTCYNKGAINAIAMHTTSVTNLSDVKKIGAFLLLVTGFWNSSLDLNKQGAEKTTANISTLTTYTSKAYKGGIVGNGSATLTNNYSTSVGEDGFLSSTNYKRIVLNYAFYQYFGFMSLLYDNKYHNKTTYITWVESINYGGISGNAKADDTNFHTNNVVLNNIRTVSNSHGQVTTDRALAGSVQTLFGMYTVMVRANITTSSVKVDLILKGIGEDSHKEEDKGQFFSYSTTIKSTLDDSDIEGKYAANLAAIRTSLNGVSGWSQDSGINGGDPYPTAMYW